MDARNGLGRPRIQRDRFGKRTHFGGRFDPPQQPNLEGMSMSTLQTTQPQPLVPEVSPIIDAEVVSEQGPGPWRRLAGGVSRGFEWCFGVLSLFVGLAILATLPIVQLLSLGYLLESSGRIARSGRLRDAFVGVRKASRLGGIVLACWLLLLPLRLLNKLAYEASLIDPQSPIARRLHILLLLTAILFTFHLAWSCFRGGRFRHFIWPAPVRLIRRIRQGGMFQEASDRFWSFMQGLRLPYYFALGAKGFFGAFAWLFFPVLLLVGATTLPEGPAVLSGLLGFYMFGFVLLHLPFLQTQLARDNELASAFDVIGVYRGFYRTPFHCVLTVVTTLLFAMPLYLLKVELTMREVAILPSLIFVAFIAPARFVSGWNVGRFLKPDRPHRKWLRIAKCVASLLLMIPAAAFYTFVVFFTRYTSWHGVWSLFEQHAFLVPVPFLGF